MAVAALKGHREFKVGNYLITVAADAGPRITGFRRPDGPELFASIPDLSISGGGHTYRFLGGHRLWVGPEVPSVTYRPDNEPVDVIESDTSLVVRGAPEADRLVKSMSVTAHGGTIAVEHQIENMGSRSIVLSPWAITQFSIGGTAYVPLPKEPDGDASLVPNRSIVVWPYTDLSSPEFIFGADLIGVEGSARPHNMKIGTANRRGWLAYQLGSELFVKWAPIHDDAAQHIDMGATVQCFRNESFVELESVGPLVELVPGRTVTHTEHWRLTQTRRQELSTTLESLGPIAGDGQS